MRILYYGYRKWALDIFNKIDIENKYLITHRDYKIIDSINPDIIFFIGWSHIIPSEVITKYKCICLHPSALPKYRGGSPIQNQIINGETKSAVTLFIMDEGIDTGDILYQKEISIEGELDDIISRIVDEGIHSINFVIKNYNGIMPRKQDESQQTFFKRRKPSDSEITIDEIKNRGALYLYNKIRSLTDPYPNAYIECGDGKKIYILKSKCE